LSFYQTNKLLTRFEEYWKTVLQSVLNSAEYLTIWKQVEHMLTIFDGMMVVEKKMWGK
jgi:hypothetical protein